MEEEKKVENPGAEIDKLLSDSPELVEKKDEGSTPVVETPKPESVEKKEDTPEPTVEKAQEKPAQTEQEKTPVKTETPENKLYAGKYTTSFDLIEGVLEEVKALGADKKSVAALVTEAQTSGDWSKVEAKYKELQAEISKKQPVAQKKDEASPTETPKKDPDETDLTPEEFDKLIVDNTMKQLSESPLSKKFEKYAVKMPTTQEGLDDLEIAYPALHMQFTEAFRQVYANTEKQAKQFIQYQKEAPGHNELQVANAKKQIADFAQKWNVGVTPEDIDSAVKEAIKSGAALVTEQKSGIDFIREGGIFKWFLAERAEQLLETVRNKAAVEADNKARIEALNDLEQKKAATPSTISTASTPSAQAKPKEVNWNNPEEAKKQGRAAISNALDTLLSDNPN